ncbi:MAG: nitroreductase [Flavobacteriales bacterium]|nr:nitroreductase [Flavobacteriales bacterium]
MSVKESIDKRWSPRAFSEKAIPKETLKEILIDAGKAPSSRNEQPWSFIVGIKGEASYDKTVKALNEFNLKWAAKAPVIILTFAKKTFARNGNPNRHALHDVGAFVAYLSLRAMEEDIYVHQMGGILPEEVHAEFDIPEDYELVTAIAMGYLGDKNDLPEDLRDSEKPESPRMGLNEFVYAEEWGKAF